MDVQNPAGPEEVVAPSPMSAVLFRSPKKVRVLVDGVHVADSTDVLLLREPGGSPVYYFPREDVRFDMLKERARGSSRTKGEIVLYALDTGERRIEHAAWSHPSPKQMPALAGRIAFNWDEMSAWFEEDEEVYVHPRDPFTRIDIAHSSRHVRFVIDGETVAESRRPVLLFETGIRVRYYMPKQDLRLDRLIDSDHVTRCPYKGVAQYYSVRAAGRIHENLAWWYPFPTVECSAISGRVALFDERVDQVFVDDVLQENP